MLSSKAALPAGPDVVHKWMSDESAKNWVGIDPESSSGYEDVWRSWLLFLANRQLVSATAPASPSMRNPRGVPAQAHSAKWYSATSQDVVHFLKPRPGQRAGHQPGRRLSPTTQRRYWQLLERIYAFAVECKWVSSNPAAGIPPAERPPPETRQSHTLPPALWLALPSSFPEPNGYQAARDRAILELLYATALAPEEVRELTWGDLLQSDGNVWPARLAATATPAELRVEGVRLAQNRTLPLPASTGAALAAWRRYSLELRGPGHLAPGNRIFASKRAGPLSTRMLFHVSSKAIHQAFRGLGDDAQCDGLIRVGPQVLRNTAIVQMLRAGRPESEVLAFTGLADANSLKTLKRLV